MKNSRSKPPEAIPPYIFVLKEGKKIDNDFLDYSLLMLQMGRSETLQSPPLLKASRLIARMLKG